jgi:uncharacterized protein YebE (UPF0316 family)
MQHFFTETLGISENIFGLVVLPIFIFLARIADVSINTIRIIYVLGGRRMTSTILGFIESLIWLLAIRQIFEHLDNWVAYIAYPGGFASGILVGMLLEERIAYGKVIVRIITRKNIDELRNYLLKKELRFTAINSIGPEGNESVVFTVLEREKLDSLLAQLKLILPTAFYTVEKVNSATENTTGIEVVQRKGVISWLRSIRRK